MIHHWPLVDWHALTSHWCLVDAAKAHHQESIGRHAFVGTHDHDVPNLKLLYRYLGYLTVLSHRGRIRGKLCQSLNRSFCPSHRIVFERMAQAEEKQQQRTFSPSPQCGSPCGGDQHQRIDLEALHPKVFDGFTQRVEAAETISQYVAHQGCPLRCVGSQLLDQVAGDKQSTAGQSEDQFAVGSQ